MTTTISHPKLCVLAQYPSHWLRERLGEPERVTQQRSGQSLWRYDNVAVTDRRLRVWPLFELSHTENHLQYFYFEIENNPIVDYWKRYRTEHDQSC